MPTDLMLEKPPASKRLRTWLIIVTILSVVGFVAAIPAAFFGTYMSAFAADDPSAPPDAVWNFMVAVWSIFACYVALIVAGVIGGWLAYRNRRNRLSFWFSMLAAGPILLTILAVIAFVVMSFVWTASIQSPVPSTPY
jgi:hypothetical protein